MKIDRLVAVAGLGVSLVVAGFVIFLAIAQSSLNAKTECWDHRVLDRAVIGHTSQAQLKTTARSCARLP